MQLPNPIDPTWPRVAKRPFLLRKQLVQNNGSIAVALHVFLMSSLLIIVIPGLRVNWLRRGWTPWPRHFQIGPHAPPGEREIILGIRAWEILIRGCAILNARIILIIEAISFKYRRNSLHSKTKSISLLYTIFNNLQKFWDTSCQKSDSLLIHSSKKYELWASNSFFRKILMTK